MVTRLDAVHLLRRTEFVARPSRVLELESLSRAEAVDDVLAVSGDPGTAILDAPENWQRGQQLVHYWLDRMAHDSLRPIQERLALFWHGHFVSSLDKVGSAELMRRQIDLWRHHGLGDLRHLAITMSTQVAMLRYLDNNDNRRTSPNQNFGRELMELFLLGVGNYTERDVEACTAAWTGHTDRWDTDEYVWRADWHDATPQPFLGSMTCRSSDPTEHGFDAIRTILDEGRATAGPRAGQPTREIAADFISRKLWTFFAGTPIPVAVTDHLRGVALEHDFAIAPWVRALLRRDEFYAADVKQGLVRSPVDYIVALLAATGLRSAQATPAWLMEGMGQALLYPPNVSGWKHNGYYVSASAFDARVQAARQMMWRTLDGYWDPGGAMRFAGGSLEREVVTGRDNNNDAASRRATVDQIVALMRIELGTTTRSALHQFAAQANKWELNQVIALIFMCPEMQVL